MKKTTIFLCLMLTGVSLIPAQEASTFITKHKLFQEAKSMFDDHNYAACVIKLNEYKKTDAPDPDLLQESDYLLAVCAYKQGMENAPLRLKEYLDKYPDNGHKNSARFYIGSSHFAAGDYSKADYWLRQVSEEALPKSEQEDLYYRTAYSKMQLQQKGDALLLFTVIHKISDKYRDAATYYIGYLQYTDKEYTSAANTFLTLKDHPEFRKSALYYLTQIYFAQGNNTLAITTGEALLSNYPYEENNVEIHRIIGNASYQLGEKEKAIQHLEIFKKGTTDAFREDLYILGLCYFETGNYPEAIQNLSSSILRNDAIGQNAYLYLGHAYLKMGDKQHAIMSYEAASRNNYDRKVKEAATYNYAILLHESAASAFGESVTILENFLNEFPQSIYTDQVNDCLVNVYLTTKNYDAALASINKISKPGNKILQAKQKIYYHLGVVAYVNNQFGEASSRFTQTMQVGDFAPEEKNNALYWRGDAFFRSGNYPEATSNYKSFLQLGQVTDARLRRLSAYNLGYCYFNQKQYAQASTWLGQYIAAEKDPGNPILADAYNRQGDCYFYNRQFKDAENSYNQSAKLQPAHADYAVFQSGFVLGLQKDYKGKIIRMDKLISQYPDSRYLPDALFEKGHAYVMLENADEAIATYTDLQRKYPQSSYARKAGVQVGMLYFNQNKLRASADVYKKVIRDYPGSDEARVSMQDLKAVYLELNDIDAYAQYVSSLGNVRFEISEQDSLTYLAAERLFMRGDEAAAQQALKKYLQSFVQGAFAPKAHYYLAKIYDRQQDYASARTEYTHVLSVGNTEFQEESLLRLGSIEYGEKDYKAAFQSYQRLSKIAERKEHKIMSLLGVMRCALYLGENADVIQASETLLKESNLSPEQIAEAKYVRAKAYLNVKEGNKAVADLRELSKDTHILWGAEANYLLAQYYFDTKQMERAETESLHFIKSGTPHAYWMARGFILLSDVYLAKGDKFQAKQYLESLQYNYKGENDDIQSMIKERMLQLQN
ncbi:MAG: tetratricopeptide repeat protein [Dysgonamonadaceae bacterium]|jgi:TolA-binding protein|nr:tetratricopeptide repeat protein [Dysgonamonadaceae bacterium]